MNIIIATPDKKKTKITVQRNQTIGQGKEIFYQKVNNRTNNQWKFMADVLKDGNTFSSYEIEENDEIEANPVSRGGIRKHY